MEQNKMHPTPWVIIDADRPGIDSSDGKTVIVLGEKDEEAGIEIKSNAEAIVLAVNNTYGIGVNPEAVKDMIEALEKVMEYFGDQLYTDSPTPKLIAAAIEKAKL